MARPGFPHWLAIVFAVFFAVLAVEPVSRTVWVAEVVPVVLVFLGLALTFPRFRFSNTAYAMMAFWLFWHTVGGHYTFANVPFEWFNGLIGAERNHFDRIGHFAVGFYAYPTAEWMLRRGHCRYAAANAFALLLVMGIAAGYEIIEWCTRCSRAATPGSSSSARRATSGTPRRTCWPIPWARCSRSRCMP